MSRKYLTNFGREWNKCRTLRVSTFLVACNTRKIQKAMCIWMYVYKKKWPPGGTSPARLVWLRLEKRWLIENIWNLKSESQYNFHIVNGTHHLSQNKCGEELGRQRSTTYKSGKEVAAISSDIASDRERSTTIDPLIPSTLFASAPSFLIMASSSRYPCSDIRRSKRVPYHSIDRLLPETSATRREMGSNPTEYQVGVQAAA